MRADRSSDLEVDSELPAELDPGEKRGGGGEYWRFRTRSRDTGAEGVSTPGPVQTYALATPDTEVLYGETEMNRFRFGPGLLVTAAFIGPGTIVTASRAGAGYGVTLLWAVLFSVAATVILQDMAARVGLAGRRGLAEAIRDSFDDRRIRVGALGLITVTILVGNAALPDRQPDRSVDWPEPAFRAAAGGAGPHRWRAGCRAIDDRYLPDDSETRWSVWSG